MCSKHALHIESSVKPGHINDHLSNGLSQLFRIDFNRCTLSNRMNNFLVESFGCGMDGFKSPPPKALNIFLLTWLLS